MGIAGVKAIWLCSVKDLKLWYITFSGDGDAKTFDCLTELKHEDQLRLYKSQKRASEVQKRRRKYKAREKVAADETAIAEEGPTYGPGWIMNSNIET